MRSKKIQIIIVIYVIFCTPFSVSAYIGPGAGFAFLGSAFVFLIAFFMALITAGLWPLRILYRKFFGKKLSKNAKTSRVFIVGLDGLDPVLLGDYMRKGMLPNFSALAQQGSFKNLQTTNPPISPVAWSSFQTGVNPGGHNIYDFLSRDKRHYVPVLSSSSVKQSKRALKIGGFSLPLGKPVLSLLRKSQPFWKVLGSAGIFSHVLRVPISFPIEKFNGAGLSAMCTPDLHGSQGTFSFYTTQTDKSGLPAGGRLIRVTKKGNKIESEVQGPANPFFADRRPICVPFIVMISNTDGSQAVLAVQGKKYFLKKDTYTDWIRLSFRAGFGIRISGICRFCLRQTEPHFKLYVSAVNIDPESPAMPVSHPKSYCVYLAKQLGAYGTLGMLEDTWALNEHVLDEETFLTQTYLYHEEREKMFFDAMDKTKEGMCACVFDASDRIQHMFWRYIDPVHPSPSPDKDKFAGAIPDMYRKMDGLLGKIRQRLRSNDVLIVMSDHGFKSFRRCVNINTWLHDNGFLTLKHGVSGSDYFQDVDWSKTKAFALGLAGIYINRQGRESAGIVSSDEVPRIKQAIIEGLLCLKDPENGSAAINAVYDTDRLYKGLYKHDAPDLIVGYADGYRVSWESVTGKLKEPVFEDNLKAWSGDHCVDANIVDGVFLCNRKIKKEKPAMYDIAPTVLDLFDVPIPSYMEGEPLL